MNRFGSLEHTPRGFPWVMEHDQRNALFLHWLMEPERVRPLVAPQLELDLFEGRAVVGQISLQMANLRFRGMPPIPGFTDFTQIDLFAFVRFKGGRGLTFISIDCASKPATFVAKNFFGVPYRLAEMTFRQEDGTFHLASHRAASGDVPAAEFDVSYRPTGEVFEAKPESLAFFLAERYTLFALGRTRRVLRGDIIHEPWPLQKAEVEIREHTIPAAAGIALPDEPPIAHYSTGIHERVWPVVADWAYR